MIQKGFAMLMVLAFTLALSVSALARGAPTKQKAFTSNAATEIVSPTVANVPVMSGYDVILNLTTEPRDLSIAQNHAGVDTSTSRRLSSTVDWRSINAKPAVGRARSGTMLRLLR